MVLIAVCRLSSRESNSSSSSSKSNSFLTLTSISLSSYISPYFPCLNFLFSLFLIYSNLVLYSSPLPLFSYLSLLFTLPHTFLSLLSPLTPIPPVNQVYLPAGDDNTTHLRVPVLQHFANTYYGNARVLPFSAFYLLPALKVP